MVGMTDEATLETNSQFIAIHDAKPMKMQGTVLKYMLPRKQNACIPNFSLIVSDTADRLKAFMEVERFNSCFRQSFWKAALKNVMPKLDFTNYRLFKEDLEAAILAEIVDTMCTNIKYTVNFWTMERFLESYTQFRNLDFEEKCYLLKFRNMLTVTVALIPASKHKRIIIDVCGMLEGSGRKYITGGGQTLATQRRTEIFHKETGVLILPRPPRKVVAVKPEDYASTFHPAAAVASSGPGGLIADSYLPCLLQSSAVLHLGTGFILAPPVHAKYHAIEDNKARHCEEAAAAICSLQTVRPETHSVSSDEGDSSV